VVRSQGSSNNCSGYRVGGNRLGINIFRFEFQDGHCLGETLAENPRYSLPAGQPFRLEVIAVGAQISAYLDGELVVEAQDAMYPSGGIDLLAYEVQWAAFDNLMVEKE
jgi:hypothetical protein